MPEMHLRILAVVITTTLLLVPAYTQQSHWASADDKTAKYIIEMERKWAEGVCVDNGVVAGLLADDFQGTSTKGARFTKADELKDEKGAHIAHDCELGEAKLSRQNKLTILSPVDLIGYAQSACCRAD